MRRKTMAEVITAHASHGLRDCMHVCQATGCRHVYGMLDRGYPVAATVAEHAADALKKAGYGDVRFHLGERKTLLKWLDSWESQGHSTVTIRFLRRELTRKPKP